MLNYTINNNISGWYDDYDRKFYHHSPNCVFKRSKAHRFFKAEDCFTNEEPFIEAISNDKGTGIH